MATKEAKKKAGNNQIQSACAPPSDSGQTISDDTNKKAEKANQWPVCSADNAPVTPDMSH